MRGTTNRSTTAHVRAALSAAVALGALTAMLSGAASAEPTAPEGAASGLATTVERISVAADGTQADDHSAGASITPDGRHIVFASSARNLPGGTNGGDRIYLRDQSTGQNSQIRGGETPLEPPAVSGNGQHVAYAVQWMRNVRSHQAMLSRDITAFLDCSAFSCNQPSLSADGFSTALVMLMKQTSSERQRIEVHDVRTLNKVTVAELPHTVPSRPSISGDGRYVAYQDGRTKDVFVWDRTGGSTSGPVEGPSVEAALVQLSDDGSKVVYLSGPDTYVHDVRTGTVHTVANVRGVAVDPTGQYLLYAPNDTTGPSLVLRDLQTGADEIVAQQPASARTDAVSAGGHDVVFQSSAEDIVPGDTNGKSDVFVRHFG